MAYPKIATGAEQPINRHGAVAGEEMTEGDLVGIDSDGHMVQAHAADDGYGPIMALGVALTPATELTGDENVPTKLIVESNRALVGRDRVSAVSNGVEVENGERDWEFTPGLPVYLGESGEYTQTAPETVGSLVQIVGSALTEERIRLDVRPSHEINA